MQAIKNKITDAVTRLDLDLAGKVVLTEAATGPYIVTPVLAALAGAEVYAFTRETRYGSVEEVRKQTNALLDVFEEMKLKVSIIEELTPEIISSADIITNSGHLRPLNSEKLHFAKKDVVIPLMYEAWERRDTDLDLAYCRQKEIKVAATNERHPAIDVFSYLGDMALKLIFDAGISTHNNSFILLCNNDFGPYIARVLRKVCLAVGVCDSPQHKVNYEGIDIDWLGDFPALQVSEKYQQTEAVIFTACPFEKKWIGDETCTISISKLKKEIPGAVLLRYAGDIDEEYCKQFVTVYPGQVQSGHMGVLPSAIGFDPVIKLQSGGLKVGESLISGCYDFENSPILELI